MPSKSVINNVSILQKLTRGAKEDVKGRVDKVVEFYRDRKISQYETAKKIINSLMSDNKRTATFAKKDLINSLNRLKAELHWMKEWQLTETRKTML